MQSGPRSGSRKRHCWGIRLRRGACGNERTVSPALRWPTIRKHPADPEARSAGSLSPAETIDDCRRLSPAVFSSEDSVQTSLASDRIQLWYKCATKWFLSRACDFGGFFCRISYDVCGGVQFRESEYTEDQYRHSAGERCVLCFVVTKILQPLERNRKRTARIQSISNFPSF